MFKYVFFALFLTIAGTQFVAAQTISHNQNGEKIVLYNDGSWRYFDENDPNDIALLGEAEKKKKTKKSNDQITKKSTKNKGIKFKAPNTKTNKGKNSKSRKRYAKAPKTKKSSTKSNVKKSKNKSGYTSITASQNYKRIINKEILDIRDKQSMAYEKERIANYAAQKYDKEYATAKKRKLSKSTLKSIDTKRKEAKLRLKLARNQNKVLLKQRRAYEAILRKDANLYAKSYTKLANKYNKDFESVPVFDDEKSLVSDSRNKRKESKKINTNKKPKKPKNDKIADRTKSRNSSAYRKTDRSFTGSEETGSLAYQVAYPSSKPDVAKAGIPDCNVVFQGKDSFSGKKRTDLGKSLFFTFTSDKMRPYFEEGDMIECEAYMSAVAGGYKFVCIEVTVASETAQRSYGSIEKQGLLALKLVDGTTINLYNNKTDNGFLDPLKKEVLYKAQYLIPNEHVKTLSKVDIDLARLVWSTGYEDYTIYETDFLINQLNCLSK